MMRSFAWALGGGCALLAAGCVSPEEQRAMDQQQCAGFGFPPGTYGFANCMMNLSQQRAAEQAASQRAWMEQQARDARARQWQWDHQRRDPHGNGMCTTTTTTDGNTTKTREICHW